MHIKFHLRFWTEPLIRVLNFEIIIRQIIVFYETSLNVVFKPFCDEYVSQNLMIHTVENELEPQYSCPTTALPILNDIAQQTWVRERVIIVVWAHTFQMKPSYLLIATNSICTYQQLIHIVTGIFAIIVAEHWYHLFPHRYPWEKEMRVNIFFSVTITFLWHLSIYLRFIPNSVIGATNKLWMVFLEISRSSNSGIIS